MRLKRKVSDSMYVGLVGHVCPACGQMCGREGTPQYDQEWGIVTLTVGPSECCNAIWDEVYRLAGYKRLRRTKVRYRKKSGCLS